MTWIAIIGLIIIVGFGPLMWLRPTNKDRRLAALRSKARSIGFSMSVKSLPRLDPAPEERVSAGGKPREATQLLAVYEWLMARRLPAMEGFRILRGPAADALSRPAVAVSSGWYFDPEQTFPPAGWATLAPSLEAHLAALPGDVAALALEPRQIALYWQESAGNDPSAVERLKDWCIGLEAALQAASAHSEAAESPLESDDVP
ncbi:MAG: hypothetical protein AAGG11_05820 [Pseudomonadota bacterium]